MTGGGKISSIGVPETFAGTLRRPVLRAAVALTVAAAAVTAVVFAFAGTSSRTARSAAGAFALQAKPPTANLFVAPSGSDAGANCRRFPRARTFPANRATVCGTFQRAYALARCGDQVLVGGGSFGEQDPTLRYQSSKRACSRTRRVAFRAAPRERVVTHGFDSYGAQHFSVSGARGTWLVTDASCPNCELAMLATSGYSCQGAATVDALFDRLSGIHVVNLGCPDGVVATDVTLQRSNIGTLDGCSGDEDLVQVRGTRNVTLRGNYIHDLTESSPGCRHSDCVQVMGANANTTFDGNTFVRCWSDGIIAKTDDGDISGLLIQNNVFGSPVNTDGSTPYAVGIFNNGTPHGCAGNGGVVVRSNTFAAGDALTVQCSDAAAVITSNLFDARSRIDNGSGGCPGRAQAARVDHNVWQGRPRYTCGTHARTGARPNWPMQTPAAGRRPDLRIGKGSAGIVDAGSPTRGDYAPLDARGVRRPLGKRSDAGAFEVR